MEISSLTKHCHNLALLAEERDGYVPDNPEDCGGMIHLTCCICFPSQTLWDFVRFHPGNIWDCRN
jgi:hypothetical protein